MNALGPLAKGLAMLVGKQPEEQLKPRGFLGLTWAERDEGRGRHLYIQDVFANSPAATGGLQNGDQIVRINDRVIETIKDARGALVNLEAGNRVRLIVLRRDGTTIQEVAITLKATEGL
jgi:S1-C subfamily serine protease